jgi:homoserine kinase
MRALWRARSSSEQRVRVRVAVPASVANLGPGFDILAVALQLQNDIRAEQRPGALTIDAGPDAPAELNDPGRNLVTIAYAEACAALGVPAAGVHFTCVNRIPIGRGMGSSAAAALSGVLVATALHQAPWDENDVLERVASLEGHRDNAAAALLGGLAICAPDAPAVQLAVSDELRAVLFIPDVPFTTSESRQVVPATFSRADAIFNAGRCALLVRALVLGDHAALAVAMQDRWHQDARFALMVGSREIVAAALAAGASGAALAGAGPSVIALTPLDPEPIAVAMAAAASVEGVSGGTMVLPPRNYGTRVDVSP